MAEKKPVKMSDADLKFFEEMLLEKRRELVTAQSESEKANVFQGQKSQSGDGGDSDGASSQGGGLLLVFRNPYRSLPHGLLWRVRTL